MFGIKKLINRVCILEAELGALKDEYRWLSFVTDNPFKYKEGQTVCIFRCGVFNKCVVLSARYSRKDYYTHFSKLYTVRVVENQIPGYIGEQLTFEEKDLLPLTAFKAICPKTEENESKGKPKK